MTKQQWDEDDEYGEGSDLGDDDDLEDDEGEEASSAPPPSPTLAPAIEAPIVSSVRPRPATAPRAVGNGKTPRRLKIKPMNASMRAKWPDVTSCLLTLTSGQQVMFVRG